jgi:hypothetical protein
MPKLVKLTGKISDDVYLSFLANVWRVFLKGLFYYVHMM